MGAWHFLLSEIAAIRDHWGPLAARKVPALVVLRVVQDPVWRLIIKSKGMTNVGKDVE